MRASIKLGIATLIAFALLALALAKPAPAGSPQQTIPAVSGGSSGTVISVTASAPLSGGTITSSGTIACATCTVDVAHGTATMPGPTGGAISANSCASAVTVSAAGVATTDVIDVTPNSSIAAISGFGATSAEGLNITWYPTAGDVNFVVCNPTGSSIAPGSAAVLNWAVRR